MNLYIYASKKSAIPLLLRHKSAPPPATGQEDITGYIRRGEGALCRGRTRAFRSGAFMERVSFWEGNSRRVAGRSGFCASEFSAFGPADGKIAWAALAERHAVREPEFLPSREHAVIREGEGAGAAAGVPELAGDSAEPEVARAQEDALRGIEEEGHGELAAGSQGRREEKPHAQHLAAAASAAGYNVADGLADTGEPGLKVPASGDEALFCLGSGLCLFLFRAFFHLGFAGETLGSCPAYGLAAFLQEIHDIKGDFFEFHAVVIDADKGRPAFGTAQLLRRTGKNSAAPGTFYLSGSVRPVLCGGTAAQRLCPVSAHARMIRGTMAAHVVHKIEEETVGFAGAGSEAPAHHLHVKGRGHGRPAHDEAVDGSAVPAFGKNTHIAEHADLSPLKIPECPAVLL